MPLLRLPATALFFVLTFLTACAPQPETDAPPPAPVQSAAASADQPGLHTTEAFKQRWYAGEAELTSYRLEQPRYGEIHDGHAVLIFVTEDFSRSKQVKLDRPGQASDDAVKVLKLNATRKFTTGIYPYSMMTSVFSPVNTQRHPHALKVNTSSQEWCGHTFLQLNLGDDAYRARQLSYFESEGDRTFDLEVTWLEDELWTRIRLAPDALPTGQIRLIPGTTYQRLRHAELAAQSATATLEPAAGRPGEQAYSIDYTEIDRTLIIYFEQDFPHAITGWSETYGSSLGPNAERLTTRAERDRSIMLDYWTRNGTDDEVLRQELNLD